MAIVPSPPTKRAALGDMARERGAAALPFVCLLATYFIYHVFKAFTRIELYPEIRFEFIPPALSVSESVGGFLTDLNWGLSGFVYIATWVACICVMLNAIWCMALAQAKGWILSSGVAVVVVGLALGAWNPMTTGPVLSTVSHSLAEVAGDPGPGWLYIANGFGISTALLFLLTATVALWITRDKLDHIKQLATRMQLIDRSLYLGAALLVTAVVQAYTLHMLALPYISPDDRPPLQDLARGIATAQGTVWTLALLAIYLPAAIVLRLRARQLAENRTTSPAKEVPARAAEHTVPPTPASTYSARQDWLKAHGLDVSLTHQLTALTAALSPFLAGTAGPALLKLFGG